jgi:protein SCO1/2
MTLHGHDTEPRPEAKQAPGTGVAGDLVSHRSRGWSLSLLYLAIGLTVAAVLAFNVFQPIKVLPRRQLAPGFSFTNQDGQRRTSEDYRGRFTVYSVTCTRCGEDADQGSARMQSLRARLTGSDRGALKYALATITVDPRYDTPAVLKDHAARFQPGGAGEPVPWDFLTGDPLRTKFVVGGGFHVYYETAPDRPAKNAAGIVLEPQFVVVDGWGIVRAQYRADVFDVDRVLRDLDYLADESRHSSGVARLAYEAAHLFRCYP